MRDVYQVVDGAEVFMQVPTTVTAKTTAKVYNVLHRIRVQAHETSLPGQPAKCQCRAAKTGCGRADYICEFYVIVDHYTKIVPVVVAQVYAKGSTKDKTKVFLSATATIVTTSVEDDSVDSPVHPPNE
jgi:hydroxymethylpyrimidine/phosphomethylpyrimidine kinase